MSAKTVLITGCSSGFGKLAVPLLLERGWTVVAGLRGGQARLEETLGPELARYRDRLVAADLHMERPETFAAAGRLVAERLGGRLDALVNNAGYGLFGAFEDQAPEQLRRQFEVNFFGPAELTRQLLPALRAARGRILNVSSIAGLAVFPFYTSYSASKYALEAFSEGLHFDLKPLGVQVALIEPGTYSTSFNERSRVFGQGSEDPSSPYRERTLALQRFYADESRPSGDPAEVARLIVRLCEKRRIRLRNVVGRDARSMRVISRLLPDSWRVALVDWGFRRKVFSR